MEAQHEDVSMNEAVLGTILLTGFSVAFVHAALPTHWLPFVLAGRGQGWSHSKTMADTALAGGGHVLFTVVLGVLVAWLGIAVDRWTGSIFPWIASATIPTLPTICARAKRKSSASDAKSWASASTSTVSPSR